MGLSFGFVAIADSRPCVVCRPSMAASYFLLLAQKKVTKEKGTLGFAPLAERAVRYGRTGSAHRASLPCCPNRRDPSRRPRFARLIRPPFAATQREPEEQSERKKRNRRVAYIRCFCGRDCRALLFPGSLSAAARTRRKSREAVAGRMPATSTRAHGCAPGEALRVLA